MPDLNLREWAVIVPLIVHDGVDGHLTRKAFLPPISASNAVHPRTRSMQGATFTCAIPSPASAHSAAEGARQCPLATLPVGDDYLRFLPEIILTVAGTLIMVLEPLLGENKRTAFGHHLHGRALAALVAAVARQQHPRHWRSPTC